MSTTAISQEALRALNLYGKTIAAGSGAAENPDRYAQGVRARAKTDGTFDKLTEAIRKGASAEEAVQTVLESPVPTFGPVSGTHGPTPEEIALAASRWADRLKATDEWLAEMRSTVPASDPKAAIATARLALRRHRPETI